MSTALQQVGRGTAPRSRKLTLEAGSKQLRLIKLIGFGLLAFLVLYLPYYYFPPYRNFQFTQVAVFAIAVLGLNLLTGYNGQISLGHGFFFAMGAYLSAILIQDYGFNYLLTIPLAFVLTFVLGYLFGIPALRLEGLYLALVTLALAVVAVPFIKRFEGLTGGSQGISVTKPTSPFAGLADDQWLFYVSLAVAALMFLLARNLVKGRVGRAVVAVRDNELAARSMGVNLSVFKSLTFAYSAAFAGVAGALFTLLVGFVSPESFGVTLSINFLAAMVIGGLATISGAIFGALYIVFVPVWASDFNQALAGVIYGLSLILVMFLMPGGVVGLLRRLRNLFVHIAPSRKPEVATGVVSGVPLEGAYDPDDDLASDNGAGFVHDQQAPRSAVEAKVPGGGV